MHLLVAAYLDYEPDAQGSATSTLDAARQAANDASIQALMAMAPQLPDHLKTKAPLYGR